MIVARLIRRRFLWPPLMGALVERDQAGTEQLREAAAAVAHHVVVIALEDGPGEGAIMFIQALVVLTFHS